MKRMGVVVVLVLFGFFGLLSTLAEAQAKVTISGYIDVRGALNHNTGLLDADYTIKTNDKGWHHSTRGRLFITGEMSPDLKGVVAFEYDIQFGQHQACNGRETAGCAGGRLAVEGGSTLGSDVQGINQLKWLYIDFRVPETPARVRAGIFPVGAAQLKVGNLLISDVPGADITIPFNDQVQAYLVVTNFEEHFGGTSGGVTLARGDDYATLANLKITPMKGVTILPVVAYEKISGSTSITTRAPLSGLALGLIPETEDRLYFGFDADWQIGNYYIAPTFIYMAGARNWKPSGTGSGNGGTPCSAGVTCKDSDIRSFLADLRGGAQFGPLRIEGFFQYTPGNSASDVAASGSCVAGSPCASSSGSGFGSSGGGKTVRYFQNIFVDQLQNSGWFQLTTVSSDLGDYFGSASGLNAATFASTRGWQPGYGPWGHILIAGKANYAITPKLVGRVTAGASWTDKKADTRCTVTFTGCDGTGDERYLGTEANVGVIYKIYPGLTADAVIGYLWTGDAYAHNCNPSTGGSNCNPENAWVLSYKLGYNF